MTMTDYEAVFYGSLIFAPSLIQYGMIVGAGNLLRCGSSRIEVIVRRESEDEVKDGK